MRGVHEVKDVFYSPPVKYTQLMGNRGTQNSVPRFPINRVYFLDFLYPAPPPPLTASLLMT